MLVFGDTNIQVTIFFTIAQNSTEYCRIRDEFKNTWLRHIPAVTNAFGQVQRNYEVSLPLEGYKKNTFTVIAGLENGEFVRIGSFDFIQKARPQMAIIPIDLGKIKKKSQFSIRVFDASNQRLIGRFQCMHQPKSTVPFMLNVNSYRQAGLSAIVVEVVNERKKEKRREVYPL
ncbi:hypothetical protein [Persicobacter diffluens]|uniref:Uncharacterized protein n=1 Tax=Persicobacter diffluens TaxID=981 RepID=A0AAN5ALI3_9BACT|nr:hypothetical protein PEDI_38310 [Persicobacter diffluens]